MPINASRRLTPEQQALVEANLKLVYKLAHKYKRARLLTFDELVSEGCYVLARYIVPSFNPDKGYRFSTYAAGAIARYMKRAMRKAEELRSRQEKDSGESHDQAIIELPDCADGEETARSFDAEEVLWSLDDVRRSVLTWRMGLMGSPILSWEEVAAEMGRTVEDVKRLYDEAIYQARAEAVWCDKIALD